MLSIIYYNIYTYILYYIILYHLQISVYYILSYILYIIYYLLYIIYYIFYILYILYYIIYYLLFIVHDLAINLLNFKSWWMLVRLFFLSQFVEEISTGTGKSSNHRWNQRVILQLWHKKKNSSTWDEIISGTQVIEKIKTWLFSASHNWLYGYNMHCRSYSWSLWAWPGTPEAAPRKPGGPLWAPWGKLGERWISHRNMVI